MKISFALMFAAALANAPVLAETDLKKAGQSMLAPTRSEVEKDIEITRWSLNRSSMAGTLPNSVVDNSNKLLDRALQELAVDQVRTARELAQRAAAPLAAMQPAARAGRHPDPREYKQSLRDTLTSLLPEAQRIAREKSAAEDFIDAARQQVTISEQQLASGDAQAAQVTLAAAYRALQEQVAALRSGDSFYVTLPDAAPGTQWDDGLRRIEERRFISQYLLIEAESSGLDIRALQRGLLAAEQTVADAERMAAEERWQPALQKLDLAYAQFEASWKTAGVDW